MAVSDEQLRLAGTLVDGLEALRQDRAAIARLRRCAGRSLAECPEAFALFYRLLPAEARGKDWLEEPCFLITTLFPLAPERYTGDLGHSLRQFASQQGQQANGVERRLAVLLDCDQEALPFRLRQTISFLAGRDVGVDWRQLLVDLLQWEWSGRPVQKRWARSYFASTAGNGGQAAIESKATA